MQYSFSHEGSTIELPRYSYAIDDAIEKVTAKEAETGISTKTIAKIKYDFIADRIGKEGAEELLGDFKDSDPNEVLIVYDKIVLAYTVPLSEYANSKLDSSMDMEQIQQMLDLLDKAERISNPNRAAKGNVIEFARSKK